MWFNLIILVNYKVQLRSQHPIWDWRWKSSETASFPATFPVPFIWTLLVYYFVLLAILSYEWVLLSQLFCIFLEGVHCLFSIMGNFFMMLIIIFYNYWHDCSEDKKFTLHFLPTFNLFLNVSHIQEGKFFGLEVSSSDNIGNILIMLSLIHKDNCCWSVQYES